MFSMPYLLLGVIGFLVRRAYKQAAERAQILASAANAPPSLTEQSVDVVAPR